MLEGKAVERKHKEKGALLLIRVSWIPLAVHETLERAAHAGAGGADHGAHGVCAPVRSIPPVLQLVAAATSRLATNRFAPSLLVEPSRP